MAASPEQKVDEAFFAAETLLDAGQDELVSEKIDALVELISQCPSEKQQPLRARLYLLRSKFWLESGDLRAALQHADTSMLLSPTPEGLLAKCRVLLQLGSLSDLRIALLEIQRFPAPKGEDLAPITVHGVATPPPSSMLASVPSSVASEAAQLRKDMIAAATKILAERAPRSGAGATGTRSSTPTKDGVGGDRMLSDEDRSQAVGGDGEGDEEADGVWEQVEVPCGAGGDDVRGVGVVAAHRGFADSSSGSESGSWDTVSDDDAEEEGGEEAVRGEGDGSGGDVEVIGVIVEEIPESPSGSPGGAGGDGEGDREPVVVGGGAMDVEGAGGGDGVVGREGAAVSRRSRAPSPPRDGRDSTEAVAGDGGGDDVHMRTSVDGGAGGRRGSRRGSRRSQEADGEGAGESGAGGGVIKQRRLRVIGSPKYDNKGYLLGCTHYFRKCAVVAPCCGKVVTCRLCHDESAEETGCEVETMDRHAIDAVLCGQCGTRQPPSNKCVSCDIEFAQYYCAQCHLWSRPFPEEKVFVWHCDGCGLCRKGNKAAYEHCNTCRTCVDVGHKECKPDFNRTTCPVCFEDMFGSVRSPFLPPCCHALHLDCHRRLWQAGNYMCPTCRKSRQVIDWKHVAEEVEATPVPAEYRDAVVPIHCNDCGHNGVQWLHFAGMKCAKCPSFNTVRTDIDAVAKDDRNPPPRPITHQPDAEIQIAAMLRERERRVAELLDEGIGGRAGARQAGAGGDGGAAVEAEGDDEAEDGGADGADAGAGGAEGREGEGSAAPEGDEGRAGGGGEPGAGGGGGAADLQ